MNKLYIIFVTFYVIVAVQSADVQQQETHAEWPVLKGLTAKEMEDLEDKILKECAEKNKVEKSVLEDFYKQDTGVPDSKEFKSLLGCFTDIMGYLTDAKPNWVRINQSTYAYHHDVPDDLKKAENIIEECKNKGYAETDHNELSYLLVKCSKEGYQKEKLEW